MKILKPEQHQAGGRGGIFLLNYAAPKCGKTRLSTSLPKAMLPAAYFAVDPKSETLSPVLVHHRKDLAVVKVGWQDCKEGEAKARFFPPPVDGWMKPVVFTEDFLSACAYPWPNYGYKTIIVDTMSQACQNALSEIAMAGWKINYGEERHVLAKGTSSFVVSPNRSDYLLAQNFARKAAIFLADQPLNVIVNCHQAVDEKTHVGGPQTVGTAILEEFTKYFDYVVSSDWDINKTTKKRTAIVRVKPFRSANANMAAGIREGTLKEVFDEDYVEVGIDPTAFWDKVLLLGDEGEVEEKDKSNESQSKVRGK